jgi:hypothetical protein
MPMLPEQPIPLRFARLGGDVDPKSGAKGQCELLENTQSRRLEDGGVEIEKRPGTPSLSTSVDAGGSVTAGAKLATLGTELVMTDGHRLYSYQGAGGKWREKGRCCSLSAVRAPIDGLPSVASGTLNMNTDGAYANGVNVFVGTPDTGNVEFFVQDANTGNILYRISRSGIRGKVVAVGNKLFLFRFSSIDGIVVQSLDTTVTPLVFGADSIIVAAASVNANQWFDVTVDTANSRMIVAYENATPGTSFVIWNTNMTVGASANYNTRDPNRCLGWLHHDYSDGNAYLAIGTSASGVRCLTLSTTTLAVGTDTQLDAAVVTARNVVGFVRSGVRNVWYEIPASPTENTRIAAWNGAVGQIIRSVGLASKMFKIGSYYYVAVAYDSSTQKSLFLLEYDPASSLVGAGSMTGGVSVVGYLLAGDAGGLTPSASCLGLPALTSSTTAVLAGTGRIPTAGSVQYTVEGFGLNFGDSLLGPPVSHNGVLHIPGAAAKVYDGAAVFEEGFFVFPEQPVTLVPSGGGSMTAGGIYQYVHVFSRLDKSGRLWRSAPGPAKTVTLGGTDGTVTDTIGTLRFVANGQFIGEDLVKIEVYRKNPGGTTFHLVGRVDNVLSVDTVALVDTASDVTIAAREGLYTDDGEVDNVTPPTVLAFCRHRDRLFAASGNGALYFTKEAASIGDTAAFSDADGFFMDFDAVDGVLQGLVSDGTTLFVSKHDSVWPVQGDGPLLDGSNGYAFPSPLPTPTGLATPRAYARTPDGILIGTPKGKQLLDRSGGQQPIPGADAYDTLTVTGGVTLDDRPMALLTTLEGRTLCWDWQLKTWHTWTGQPAVASCLWQGRFCWLGVDGKVHVETPGLFADDAGAYTWVVQLSWVDMVHAYLKRIEVIGEAFGTCTLTALGSYDYDEANVDTSRSWALAVSGPKAPWILEPDQGYCEAYNLKLTETSTTQGVKLAKLLAWVGLLPGSHKHAPSQYAT